MRVIRFTKPVRIGGIEVASVTMREPTVEDEIQASTAAGPHGTPFDTEVRLMAIVTGLTLADLRQATSAVYNVLKQQLASFLVSQPEYSVETPSSSPVSAKVESVGTASGG